MPQSIFISYVHEDKKYRDQVERWFDNERVGPNRISIAESKDMRAQGEQAILAHIGPLIRGSAAVLCLVGDNTHNHDWIVRELDLATSLNKKVVFARIPGTRGSAPIKYQKYAVHTLDPSLVRKLLDQ